ncbi:MAG: winged helix-turn-helix transcriptional regulator [Reyranella sp.]|nr:winged helix-turn-helix transcriptional regulator [Reyranella sp.]
MAKIDPARLALSATAATRLLKALANRNRLLILCQLSDGELGVGELGDRVGLSPSALSQHLAGLKRLGIVDARRNSRSMHYRLAKGPAQQLMKTLADIYCRPPFMGSPSSGKRSRRRSAPAA